MNSTHTSTPAAASPTRVSTTAGSSRILRTANANRPGFFVSPMGRL